MWFLPSWPIESLTRKDDVAPSQKTPAPFPRPLLKRLLVSILWAGYAQAEDLSTLWHKKKSTILHQCTQVWLSTLSAPSGYPITAKNYYSIHSLYSAVMHTQNSFWSPFSVNNCIVIMHSFLLSMLPPAHHVSCVMRFGNMGGFWQASGVNGSDTPTPWTHCCYGESINTAFRFMVVS